VVHSYGTRVCLHLGVFFQTLSFIGASFAVQKYQIILSQGICFGWGMGFLFVGSVGIIAQWFTKNRSLANAVATAGSGFGGLIYSLATQRIIDTLGLAWTFRILGIVSCFVNLVCANLLRDRNKAVGARHKAFDFRLLKQPEFVLLQGWSIFSMLGYTAMLFSLPNYATSIGLSAKQGSIIGALMNLGQMLGRPIMGLVSDRYGRINVACCRENGPFVILCNHGRCAEWYILGYYRSRWG
jgi:MFS family permease